MMKLRVRCKVKLCESTNKISSSIPRIHIHTLPLRSQSTIFTPSIFQSFQLGFSLLQLTDDCFVLALELTAVVVEPQSRFQQRHHLFARRLEQEEDSKNVGHQKQAQ